MKTFQYTVTYAAFAASISKHLAADHLIQGNYSLHIGGGVYRGCHVGCSLMDFTEYPGDHSEYEKLFGIPEVLAYCFDNIHEGLAQEDTPWFLTEIRDALCAGMDLNEVWPTFLNWLLAGSDNPYSASQIADLGIIVSAFLFDLEEDLDFAAFELLKPDEYYAQSVYYDLLDLFENDEDTSLLYSLPRAMQESSAHRMTGIYPLFAQKLINLIKEQRP